VRELKLVANGSAAEAVLEEMAHAPVLHVEQLRIEPVEHVHAAPEIRLARLDHEMNVVLHQAVGAAVPAKLMNDRTEQPQVLAPILVIEEDRAFLNAAGKDVMDTSFPFRCEVVEPCPEKGRPPKNSPPRSKSLTDRGQSPMRK
jgi:hypothetical protein